METICLGIGARLSSPGQRPAAGEVVDQEVDAAVDGEEEVGEGQHPGQQLGRVAQDLQQARHDLQRVAEDEDEHDHHGDSSQPGSW